MTGRLTKGQVKRAGRILSDESASEREMAWVRGVADEWGAGASRVPGGDGAYLPRRRARSQQGKKLESIVEKLRRGGLCMKQNEMNDCVGCRVVVPTVEDVRHVVSEIAGRIPPASFLSCTLTWRCALVSPRGRQGRFGSATAASSRARSAR